MELTPVIKLLLFTTILSEVLSIPDRIPFSSRQKYCRCGEIGMKSVDRVTGGKNTIPNAYPWQAMVVYLTHLFGGTIINDGYVLTSGEILSNYSQINAYTVILGIHNISNRLDESVQFYRVKKIIIHYNFDMEDVFSFNIGLLKLHPRITFTESIKPICLPNQYEQFEYKIATITGWGCEWELLREIEVKVLTRKLCQEIQGKPRFSIICTDETRNHSCQDDAGGPMFYKNQNGIAVQIGIINRRDYNTFLTGVKSFSFYTLVSSFLDWIKEHTKDASYCNRY